MMYNSKLVASVKVGGKIMREDGEAVYLPFGSEYSFLLKNLNTRKALVKVEIDNEEVTGGGLILHPNQTMDFERFILDNNLDAGPKFKFIEKTQEISDYRGDKLEDGLVRITYQFEAAPVYTDTWVYPVTYGSPYRGVTNTFYSGNIGNMNVGSSVDGSSSTVEQEVYTSGTLSINDKGITTKGSDSDQKFSVGHIGNLETTSHAIILQLKGQVGQHVVQQPVTVSRKIRCEMCGKSNFIGQNKFCPKCGTNLTQQY